MALGGDGCNSRLGMTEPRSNIFNCFYVYYKCQNFLICLVESNTMEEIDF